jgi:ubiquinone/menaquinone biosynthesis C-methylase UbiE
MTRRMASSFEQTDQLRPGDQMANVFESLKPAERARQLANPEGETGLAVAEWLNGNNQEANARMVALLDLQSGAQVLEIGPGNGRIVPGIISAAPEVHYTGIDISPTMVEEATRFNADLVTSGQAAFHLGTADQMPFGDATFDAVFSLGVIHFWERPERPLSEIRRVLRSGGRAVMGCLAPRSANEISRPEYGFFLREASEWHVLCRTAGFTEVRAQEQETNMIAPDGTPIVRYTVQVMAWA